MIKVGEKITKLTFWGNPGREYATLGDTLRVFPDRSSVVRPVAGRAYNVTVSAVMDGRAHGHTRGKYLFVRVEAEWAAPPPPPVREKAAGVIRLLKEYPACYEAGQAERMWEKAHI